MLKILILKKSLLWEEKEKKIENEGFYNQKHRTFNTSHLNSRNDTL